MHFPTTRWTLIFSARARAQRRQAIESLSELCRIYWRPVFGFICQKGYSVQEAEDLTQDFFIRILDGKILRLANPSRGRFRSLLLKSLKNFLIDDRVKRRRRKRGGGFEFVSWEDWDLGISGIDVADHGASDALFDMHWAAALINEAVRRLRIECEGRGYQEYFELLSPYLDSDRAEISYQALATRLGASTKSVKSLLHEFRKRFRTILREEVAKTLEAESDLDEEIRYLCTAIASFYG